MDIKNEVQALIAQVKAGGQIAVTQLESIYDSLVGAPPPIPKPVSRPPAPAAKKKTPIKKKRGK